MRAHFILYVSDQKASAEFYAAVLGKPPDVDVPGMTEFHLNAGAVLGLMPGAGIKRLLGDRLPDPSAAGGIPRAEVYLLADEPEACHRRALANGARELSPLMLRDWGHEAAYCLDPDGHVLAFAMRAISFAADGLSDVVAGRKRETLRFGEDFDVGETVRLVRRDGEPVGFLRIEGSSDVLFRDLGPEDVRSHNSESLEGLRRRLLSFYPELTPGSRLKRYRFRFAHAAGQA